MNKLRQHWKENGTPFYFNWEYLDGTRIFIPSNKCNILDLIPFDDNGTVLDILVDVQFINRSLDRLSSSLLITSLRYELDKVVSLVLNHPKVVSYVYQSSSYKESI